MPRLRSFHWFALLLMIAPGTGCQDRPAPQFAVAGKVLVKGKPAARAKVFFNPVSPPEGKAPAISFAETGTDGTFRLTTEAGVPAGEYAVTVIWPGYRPGGDEEVETGDRLKGRYASTANPVARVTITAGDNNLTPFDLQP